LKEIGNRQYLKIFEMICPGTGIDGDQTIHLDTFLTGKIPEAGFRAPIPLFTPLHFDGNKMTSIL